MPSIQEPLEAKQEPVQLHAHPWQACVVWGGAKHGDSTHGLLMLSRLFLLLLQSHIAESEHCSFLSITLLYFLKTRMTLSIFSSKAPVP